MAQDLVNLAQSSLPDVMLILMATIGGAARYTDRYLNHGAKPVLARIPLHLFVSGFTGYICAHLALQIAPEFAWVMAGLGGFAGTKSIDLVSDVIQSRLGTKTSFKGSEKAWPVSDTPDTDAKG